MTLTAWCCRRRETYGSGCREFLGEGSRGRIGSTFESVEAEGRVRWIVRACHTTHGGPVRRLGGQLVYPVTAHHYSTVEALDLLRTMSRRHKIDIMELRNQCDRRHGYNLFVRGLE